jgi:hypothetical protein
LLAAQPKLTGMRRFGAGKSSQYSIRHQLASDNSRLRSHKEGRLLKVGRKMPTRTIDPEGTNRAVWVALEFALCVATDDPRLKDK